MIQLSRSESRSFPISFSLENDKSRTVKKGSEENIADTSVSNSLHTWLKFNNSIYFAFGNCLALGPFIKDVINRGGHKSQKAVLKLWGTLGTVAWRVHIRKIDLLFQCFKLFIKYIYMTKKFFIGLGGRILSQNSIFYTKVDP